MRSRPMQTGPYTALSSLFALKFTFSIVSMFVCQKQYFFTTQATRTSELLLDQFHNCKLLYFETPNVIQYNVTILSTV